MAAHPPAPVVPLAGGIGMIPLSESWLQDVQRRAALESEGDAAPAELREFEFLTPAMEVWIRRFSKGAEVAYVETEYFAGEGFERAAVWRDGVLVLGPLDGAGAINGALKCLGVVAEPGREEFDVVGLGRHRSLDEWLSDPNI